VGACLAFHTLGLYSMPFEQPGAVLRELAAAGLLLPGGVLLGVFFPLGLARVGPGWIGRCLLADGLGVIFAYGALVLVALPCGLTALLTLALVAYTLAATLGWGRGWSQPPPG
jgi:hypothetical protein